jgi:hypothetical protein
MMTPDEEIEEITRYITTDRTDEGMIKILKEQVEESNRAIQTIEDRIEEYERLVQNEKHNLDFFSINRMTKIRGIKLLKERISNKRINNP